MNDNENRTHEMFSRAQQFFSARAGDFAIADPPHNKPLGAQELGDSRRLAAVIK